MRDDRPSPGEAGRSPILDPWQRFVVPPFPFDTLPPVLRRFVTFQARNIGADPSAIAMAALAACSGALDHRFAVKMMIHGDWWAHPRLWVALIGAVSSKKTPILRAWPGAPPRGRGASSRTSTDANWRFGEVDKGCAAKGAPDKPREPPPPVRYIVNDVTVEKLAERSRDRARNGLGSPCGTSWPGGSGRWTNTAATRAQGPTGRSGSR